MSFIDAVRSVLTQYVGFSGRARRSEYWWFALFNVIVTAVARAIDAAFGKGVDGDTGPVAGLVGLALLLPGLAVGVRRLHDTGRSGWWMLLVLIPILGWIALVVFFVQDSHADNKFGPSPKQQPGLTAAPGGYGAPPQPAYGTQPQPASGGYGTPPPAPGGQAPPPPAPGGQVPPPPPPPPPAPGQ